MAFNSISQQNEMVQTLLSIQPNCTELYARQILQKHNWNVEQAAIALLDAQAANDISSGSYAAGGSVNASNPPPARPNSVIDLTMDEEEDLATSKAVEASLSTQPPVYGPVNADSSNWALVPSSGQPILSQEEQAISQAVAASLNTGFSAGQDIYEEPLDFTERVRKPGSPLVFRSTDPTLIHAAVVLQCLLNLPRIQERLEMYDPETLVNGVDDNLAKDLQRLCACQALSARAYIPVNTLLQSTSLPFQVSKNHEPLAGSIREYYQFVAKCVEKLSCDSSKIDYEGLLEFQGGTDFEKEKDSDGCYIEVNVPTPYGNDLMSCLAHCFAKSEVFLSRLSECFAFLICREEPSPLKFPSRIYMDRFLKDNIEHANKLMHFQEGTQHEIQKLETDRHKVSNWQNQDTLKALRSTLYYFENLVNDSGDLTRRANNQLVISRLRTIIKDVEAKIEYLETRIKDLTAETENLFSAPDFQKHPYDLNAVIMHDGLFGRSHLYSYTKDPNGTWWKIVDYHVSEVSEDVVLNDQAGLHLGSGPVLLLYAKPRNVDLGSLNFPRDFMETIESDNQTFLSNPSEEPSRYATPNDTLTSLI